MYSNNKKKSDNITKTYTYTLTMDGNSIETNTVTEAKPELIQLGEKLWWGGVSPQHYCV